MAPNGKVAFEDVTAEDISALEARRIGDSARMIAAFLETGKFAVRVPTDGTDESAPQRLAGAVSTNARNNGQPVRAVVRDGAVYLRRLDIDKDGKPVANWKDAAKRNYKKRGTAVSV